MMKKYAVFFCFLVVIIPVVCRSSTVESGANKIIFTDQAKPIIVAKSKPEFDLILQSNPTTGYSWVLKEYDANLVVPIQHKFYPSAGDKKLVGAPGHEKWTFRVKPQGFTVSHLLSISLIYLRQWEEQGIQTANFKVVTNNAN